MEWGSENMPQLSNEKQLILMNKVKKGELSIDDALHQARKDQLEQLHLQKKSVDELQESKPSQYSFSVQKYGRYRWQKRVIQFDFKTKLLCSIEKGIIKRQLPFSTFKSCDDGTGSRFSISFKGHHDYELEAMSLDDKYKMMELVNEIIYGNIYTDNGVSNAETPQQPKAASESLREGVLLLHRGGLASLKWVKYEVQLHPGQLVMVPTRRRTNAYGEVTPAVPTVIHLSDGDTSVQKQQSSETFSLITHKNEYHFRMPPSEQPNARSSVQKERDAWVQAIDKLCRDWKRKSCGEHLLVQNIGLRNVIIAEEEEDSEKEQEPSSDQGSKHAHNDSTPVHSSSEVTPAETVVGARPVPRPRVFSNVKPGSPKLSPAHAILPPSPEQPQSPENTLPQSPISLLPPSPSSPPSRFSVPSGSPKSVHSPTRVWPQPSVPSLPPAPVNNIIPPPPAPPPLPVKATTMTKKSQTKAFHWDVLGPEKISKSFWAQKGSREIEIDTSRLYEQFAVKKFVPGMPELVQTQNIMLNQKIAHTFSIFLKSFPVHPGELKDKLFIVNEKDGGLSDEHINALRSYVPTMDDVEMYKSHKGPVTELHIVDQYMMEMCNIPFLSNQLHLLLTLRELPVSMNDLQPLINQKITMCQKLYNSRSFVSVLEYLLAVGNYLNENAGKGKAKGFRLSTLTKIAQLRGKERKFTLMHALVEQIMLHEPALVTFTEELAEFETVSGASIKGLTAEVDVLKNELQKVVQYRKVSKKRNMGDSYPNFLKDLKTSIVKYKLDLSALTKTCEEMKKLYSVILVKFGEAADQDSQELFGVICQFIHDFKRAHAETV